MPEEVVVRYCAPTLAGLKTGSLFTSPCEDRETMEGEVLELNRNMNSEDLRAMVAGYCKDRALIYIYSSSLLERDLKNDEIRTMLETYGYETDDPKACLEHLKERLEESEFPHEIGYFLGYPPKDVQGFIENRRPCKCIGDWKVYDDEETAKKLFALYRRCTKDFERYIALGKSLRHLTYK